MSAHQQSSPTHDITILGAGLVGSLLAVYLARRNYSVTIYERRSDPRTAGYVGGRSINLALSDRGWKGLAGVGLEQEVKKWAIPMYGRMVHHPDGSCSPQPYGRPHQAIYSVSRAALNKLLLTAAESTGKVRIVFDRFCARVDLKRRQLYFSNGPDEVHLHSSVPYQLLFGADGAYSALRHAMLFTDHFNFEQTYIEHSYKELHIPPGPEGQWQLEKNYLHIWPRKNFMLIALPNPDGSFTCTLFLHTEGPVSFAALRTPNDVQQFFAHYFADAVARMPDYIHDFFHNPTSSLLYVKCYPWATEHTCLIGDAAHAIVPFFGQGMNCGFEDCTVLDGLMDEVAEWPQRLFLFQQQRKPNTDAICALALNNFIEMRDLVADPHFLLKKKIEQHIAERWAERYVSPYQMVSFSHLPYAEALQKGKLINEVLEELAALPDWQQRLNEPYWQRKVDSVCFGPL
ncbi:MAG: FAD-dependent monooxygenase [Chitinophagales bacterium]|nr:FAD-dependent monooxygenase [Chitinophagales bacterium]MDW8427761.1 NAD(P)/FAD-dependent oxidoreductase [Chitinophagales bacterium]